MQFDPHLIGHDLPQKILYNAIMADKMGHAYLFSGEERIGKRSVAFAVAKSLLCQKSVPFCGQCPSCTRADQRIHPDLFEIAPEGAFIKISQVKQVQDQMALQAAMGSKKIFIIDGLDQMNLEAANSFLKSLEEPPADTYFFLISSRPYMIPSTLLSRCQQIRFSLPSEGELVKFLMTRKNLAAGDALRIAKRSQGKVGIALSLEVGTLDRDDEIYFKLLQPGTASSPSKLFQFSEELTRDADLFKKTLEWISTFLRDMILWKTCQKRDLLIFHHQTGKIEFGAEEFSLETLYRTFAFLQKIEKLTARNLNRPLVLETIILQLYGNGQIKV